MSEPFIIGIDLGTTNTLVSYMTAGGPVVVRDDDGRAMVPSVIAFDPAVPVSQLRRAT